MFVDCLQKFKIKDRDAEKFFDSYAIGTMIFYKQVLMDLYGKSQKIKGLSDKHAGDETAIAAIKQKLKNHMKNQNWSLSDLYKICNKSNSNSVKLLDFQSALKGCLTIDEANKLFMCMDMDKSNDCSE